MDRATFFVIHAERFLTVAALFFVAEFPNFRSVHVKREFTRPDSLIVSALKKTNQSRRASCFYVDRRVSYVASKDWYSDGFRWDESQKVRFATRPTFL